jgi:transposase
MRPTASRRNARGLRDRQAFEPIRLQAGALFAAGRSQAEVAHQLGVSRQNVSRWHGRWRSGGSEALPSAGPTGHPRACPMPSLRRSARRSDKAPAGTASNTDHWTLARIATVIEQLTGVAYHPGHVGKLLRRRLGWRPSAPCPPGHRA